MAPELWSDDTEYTNNVDCWALGVVTYLLFSRIRPFDGTNITEKALKKKIESWEPSFTGKMWDGVNQKAINFIKRCLLKDYNQRPHADELLNDEWISEHNP